MSSTQNWIPLSPDGTDLMVPSSLRTNNNIYLQSNHNNDDTVRQNVHTEIIQQIQRTGWFTTTVNVHYDHYKHDHTQRIAQQVMKYPLKHLSFQHGMLYHSTMIQYDDEQQLSHVTSKYYQSMMVILLDDDSIMFVIDGTIQYYYYRKRNQQPFNVVSTCNKGNDDYATTLALYEFMTHIPICGISSLPSYILILN